MGRALPIAFICLQINYLLRSIEANSSRDAVVQAHVDRARNVFSWPVIADQYRDFLAAVVDAHQSGTRNLWGTVGGDGKGNVSGNVS